MSTGVLREGGAWAESTSVVDWLAVPSDAPLDVDLVCVPPDCVEEVSAETVVEVVVQW